MWLKGTTIFSDTYHYDIIMVDDGKGALDCFCASHLYQTRLFANLCRLCILNSSALSSICCSIANKVNFSWQFPSFWQKVVYEFYEDIPQKCLQRQSRKVNKKIWENLAGHLKTMQKETEGQKATRNIAGNMNILEEWIFMKSSWCFFTFFRKCFTSAFLVYSNEV